MFIRLLAHFSWLKQKGDIFTRPKKLPTDNIIRNLIKNKRHILMVLRDNCTNSKIQKKLWKYLNLVKVNPKRPWKFFNHSKTYLILILWHIIRKILKFLQLFWPNCINYINLKMSIIFEFYFLKLRSDNF